LQALARGGRPEERGLACAQRQNAGPQRERHCELEQLLGKHEARVVHEAEMERRPGQRQPGRGRARHDSSRVRDQEWHQRREQELKPRRRAQRHVKPDAEREQRGRSRRPDRVTDLLRLGRRDEAPCDRHQIGGVGHHEVARVMQAEHVPGARREPERVRDRSDQRENVRAQRLNAASEAHTPSRRRSYMSTNQGICMHLSPFSGSSDGMAPEPAPQTKLHAVGVSRAHIKNRSRVPAVSCGSKQNELMTYLLIAVDVFGRHGHEAQPWWS
jgi:hypothetical protein